MRRVTLLLLLMLAWPLVRVQAEDGQQPTSQPGPIRRCWEKLKDCFVNIFTSSKTTAAPSISQAEGPAAEITTPVPVVRPTGKAVSDAISPSVAETTKPTEVTPPEGPSASEESDGAREEAGQAPDKQVGGGSSGGATFIPWWVGLLTGLTLAGWIVACAAVVMYRRGCALAVQRRQEAFEMSKLSPPIACLRFCEPPPCYQNSSYLPSPDSSASRATHIYEEPQFPSGAVRSSDAKISRKPSISTRPPAVPFRPEERPNVPILSDSGAVDPGTSNDTGANHRNSLYNRVPSLIEETAGLCPVCSIETESGRAVTCGCRPPAGKEELGEVPGTDRETSGAGEPHWRFLLPGAENSEAHNGEPMERPMPSPPVAGATADDHDSSFIGCAICSSTYRLCDASSEGEVTS